MFLLFRETMLSRQLNPSEGWSVSHQFLFCIHNLLFSFVSKFTPMSKPGLPKFAFFHILETIALIPCSISTSCFAGETWTFLMRVMLLLLVLSRVYCQRQLWILNSSLLLHLPTLKEDMPNPSPSVATFACSTKAVPVQRCSWGSWRSTAGTTGVPEHKPCAEGSGQQSCACREGT